MRRRCDTFMSKVFETKSLNEPKNSLKTMQKNELSGGRHINLYGIDLNYDRYRNSVFQLKQPKALAYTQDSDVRTAVEQEKYPVQLQPVSEGEFLESEEKLSGIGKRRTEGYFNTAPIDKNEIKKAYNKYCELFREIETIISGCVVKIDQCDESKYNIKNAFSTKDNIHTIIGKLFSSITGASVQLGSYNAYLMYSKNPDLVKNIISDLGTTIGQTLEDILFWTIDKEKEIGGSLHVSNIRLTDSDLHFRGIGVCIVTFDNNEKLVIKPGDKSFEKIVYGNDDDSIASQYNNIFGKNIGRLKIRRGTDLQETREHGSAIEYFEHEDIDKNKSFQIEESSLKDIMMFASLLGLADLHHENLVFGTESHRAQLIDAEVGLAYTLDDMYLLETSKNKGEMVRPENNTFLNAAEENKDLVLLKRLKRFLKKRVKRKLKGLKCRILPFTTGELYELRTLVYSKGAKPASFCGNQTEAFTLDKYKTKLENNHIPEKGIKTSLITVYLEIAYQNMIDDFNKGRIPYYELHLDDGIIYQVFSNQESIPVLEYKSAKIIINKNIEILDKAVKPAN